MNIYYITVPITERTYNFSPPLQNLYYNLLILYL